MPSRRYAGTVLLLLDVLDSSIIRRACANTSTIMGRVSFPVNVFCWLGWKLPARKGPLAGE